MPLTDEEKTRVRYHLGYPAVTSAASIQLGTPAYSETAWLVDAVLPKLLDGALPRVRSMLVTLEGIETKMVEAQDRLAATQLETLKLREDEIESLEREYRRWAFRLAELLGCPIYPGSSRFKGIGTGAGNIPVRVL